VAGPADRCAVDRALLVRTERDQKMAATPASSDQNQKEIAMKTLMIMLALLCSCSSKHELAKCKGPLIALNNDRWHPTDTEIVALDKLCPEDK
jgi:hypothetical protein